MANLRKGTWSLLALLSALMAGCAPPGRPRGEPPVPADQVKDFDALYARNCSGCHGADGKLGPAPPLNDPLFLAVVPDAELLRVINEGRTVTAVQKTPMPAFHPAKGAPLTEAQAKAWAELKEESHADPRQQSPLTAAQVRVLAEGIKKRWGSSAPAGDSAPSYLGTAGGNKEQGAQVFARACAGCHGADGQGGANGDMVGGAINTPAFLALISDQALRRYAITGRPDLGMPPYDGKAGRGRDFRPLTSAQIDDLVALLAYWRQGQSASGK